MGLIGAKWFFEAGAGVYDWLTYHETWRNQCRELASHFPIPDGRRLEVLDVGTGPGMSAIGIKDRVADARVVGVDFSARMIARARGNVARSGHDIELLRADATELPFDDESFDVATAHSFIYLVPQRERVLAEIRRVLRPGGRVVFVEPHQDAPRGALFRVTGDVRFRISMVTWRMASGTAGRFTRTSLTQLLEREFEDVHIEPTLGGLGLLARATRS